MIDERWSEDVEEIGEALRRVLAAKCTPEIVRNAEASADGRCELLERHLGEFGLDDLEGEADMFARVAYEFGRALVPVSYVEQMPVQSLCGRSGVALGFCGLVPAQSAEVATRNKDGVFVQATIGKPERTAAGDNLIRVVDDGAGERLGDSELADRLERFERLVGAARIVGAGQALLCYGADYAGEREQFGKIIGQYQGVAHRLADVAGALDAAELLIRKAAFAAISDNGGDGAPPKHFAIMAWAKAVEAGRFAATGVHQTFGGNGFSVEYDVQLYSRRIRSWAMRGPRPGAQLAEMARIALDPQHRDEMAMLWHFEKGIHLPRWAREADRAKR